MPKSIHCGAFQNIHMWDYRVSLVLNNDLKRFITEERKEICEAKATIAHVAMDKMSSDRTFFPKRICIFLNLHACLF